MAVPAQRRPGRLTTPRTPAQIVRQVRKLHTELERSVIRLRLHGRSWAEVAEQLGVSKSAAYERYRHLDTGQVITLFSRDWGESGRFVMAQRYSVLLNEVLNLGVVIIYDSDGRIDDEDDRTGLIMADVRRLPALTA